MRTLTATVTDCERTARLAQGALWAGYSSHINRTGLMARISAAQALQILQANGHSAYQQKAPRGTCPTCCYRVDGKAVNLGRLRQLAEELA
jgi:hypothetical protein